MTQAAEVTVKVNVTDVMAKIAARLEKGLAFAANDLRERVKQRISISNQGGLFPADPGESVHYGAGDMTRALYSKKHDHLEYHVGFQGAPQARLQEYGGVVEPKNKLWLTVPASPEALRHKTMNRSAREFPRKLHFVPTNDPNLAYLVERDGASREVIHYLMRKRVYIPAHPTLRPAVHDPEWQRRAMGGFKGDATGIEVAE